MAFAFPDERWLPKSVLCLRDYNLNKFGHDVIAGITVGLVALPLAMAFSIASGLTPQAGIYCAMVTGFLISALGGSKTQIGGPMGAFVVVVAGIVATHGVDGLFMCTVMAGILLVVYGRYRNGDGGEIYPATGRDRVHQRNCGFDCQHTGEGLLRPASGKSAGRVLATDEGTRRQLSDMVTDSDNPRRRHSWHDVVVPRTFKAHSGADCCHAGSHRHGFCIKAPRGDY